MQRMSIYEWSRNHGMAGLSVPTDQPIISSFLVFLHNNPYGR